jgi:nicotinamidase-related amidase
MERLIAAEDSALVVVDVQPGFVERLEPEEQPRLVGRIAFVIESARACGVPIVATVESPERWGGVHTALEAALGDVNVLRKEVFGLADDDAVFPSVAELGRQTVVLVGMETDVCVAHSALGLLDRGYRVVCVADAVASPGSAHEFGLERIRAAGGLLMCAKQLHYEWLRTVASSVAFRCARPGFIDPPGVLL